MHRIRCAERSDMVIWPKFHGSQSANVRSYSSVINEENNVNDKEQFNVLRPKKEENFKYASFLANIVITIDLRVPKRTFNGCLNTKRIKKIKQRGMLMGVVLS